jgi:acyl dehydratase
MNVYAKVAAGAVLEPLRSRPDAPPDHELATPVMRVDRDHLAAYDRVCGFRLSDRLPATYPHVLAFPAAMELMASGDFPFGVLGLVHVANTIEQLRPLHADEPLTFHVFAQHLADHPRGRTIDIVAEASAGDDEIVWRDRSTYLHREGRKPAERRGGTKVSESFVPRSEWKVPGDVGRRYAAVSGDRNPIHLHGVPARLLGQPGAIAHGMWTNARCLAALEGMLPGAFTVAVEFKLPLVIPAKVTFGSWVEEGERRFALRDKRGEKPHLTGAVTPSVAA